MSGHKQKAIFFDLMGTCCDWLSSLLPTLHTCPPHPSLEPAESKLRELAIAWREGFFQELHTNFSTRGLAEDIDVTHRRVLDKLLEEKGVDIVCWDDSVRDKLVRQWHNQTPWPDVTSALNRLKEDRRWFLVVLANGSTRLQLDIAQSSGLPFHTLLSSEVLGLTKPDPAIYQRAMQLVRLPPEDCFMLASHLYDLEAAKSVGLRTIYVHRTTEDVDTVTVDMKGVHRYVDMYFDGRENHTAGPESGFSAAVTHLLATEI
jgi:2-haloalkanoic acid dehalogenase type II